MRDIESLLKRVLVGGLKFISIVAMYAIVGALMVLAFTWIVVPLAIEGF